MINAIINGLFTVVQWLVALILAPIDLLLANIPVLNEAANGISSFLFYLADALRWPMDFLTTPLKTALFGFLTAWIFFSNQQRAVSLIKLAWTWLQKLKFW